MTHTVESLEPSFVLLARVPREYLKPPRRLLEQSANLGRSDDLDSIYIYIKKMELISLSMWSLFGGFSFFFRGHADDEA